MSGPVDGRRCGPRAYWCVREGWEMLDEKREQLLTLANDAELRELPVGDSILAAWVRSICQTLRGYGIEPEPLLERAGLDRSLLGVPGARYPATQVRRLWEQLLSETDDPLVGMRCGQKMQVATLHSLGLAVVTSRSLSQVLDLVARYAKIISSTMDVSLSHNHEGTTLRLRTLKGTEPGGSASLAMLAFILRQANSLSHHKVTPTAVGVCLPHLPETDRKRLDRHFGVAVDTSAECAHITFAYPDTIEPYASANAILREVTEELSIEYLNRVRQASFASRAEEVMTKLLANGQPRIKEVADAMHLSSRTLQRRLEREGVSFAELLDRLRKRLAHDMLAHSERPITEISYDLGFSDPSNFNRACNRWFGTAPAAYRKRMRTVPT